MKTGVNTSTIIHIRKRYRKGKECKLCKYFMYGYNEQTRKFGYKCKLTNKNAKTYNQIRDCKKFEQKVID